LPHHGGGNWKDRTIASVDIKGMKTRCRLIPALLALGLAGCGTLDDGPITVSVIGPPLKLADPLFGKIDLGSRETLAATAWGLVSFDADGRIAPALAERWILTDDGRSFIFRIRRATWSDGKPVTARDVATQLRTIMAPASRHPLKPLFGNVEQVIAMTGQVIEMRLKAPQPELMQLFAQPEMAVFHGKPSRGAGPYRVHSVRNGVSRLRPVPDPTLEEPEDRGDRDDIRLRGEAASSAVARFIARDVDLVRGGSFVDLALARAARPASAQFQVDPVYGLFGFAVMPDSTVLADSNVRKALAMSLDRDRIVRSFGVSTWQPQFALLPAQLDSLGTPAVLGWITLQPDERVARARSLVGGGGKIVRIAMPEGPGARLLFAAVAADWSRIGIEARRVPYGDAADLRLIDEVAPHSSALWYLNRLACTRGINCDPSTQTAIRAALTAPDVETRRTAIAEADAKIAERQLFIPIALPLRWSLVSPKLTGWRNNAFAVHALRHLKDS
jgi:oligopeptide transport system substrate-binding protein